MKYLKEFLIAVLIVCFFWMALDDQIQRKKVSELDAKEQRLKASFDSLKSLQNKADIEAILALTDLEVARNQLRNQSKVTESLRIKYETIRRIGPVRLTDAQIDSAANALYPIR